MNKVGGGIMAIVMAVIGIMIAFIMFPTVMDSANDAATDPQTDALTSTTGVGETTDTVTLTQPLYDDSVTNITSITSTNGADTPAASTYASATRILTVSGLAASGTRTFTILYAADATSNYMGLKEMIQISPMMILILIIFAILGGMWVTFSGTAKQMLGG